MSFKVVVAGSRTFNDYEFLKEKLNKALSKKENVTIISGGARGADYLGEKYAKEYNLDLIICPADWDKHGKGAGYIRNKEMVAMADGVVVFWDGISKGTKHTMELSNSRGIPLKVYKY